MQLPLVGFVAFAFTFPIAARCQQGPPGEPASPQAPAGSPQEPGSAPATPPPAAPSTPPPQEPAPGTAAPVPTGAPTTPADPAAGTGPEGRRGARGRRGRRGGEAGQGGQGPGGDEGEADPEGAIPEPKPERRGLRVDDALTQSYCVRCHARDEQGLMTRISYVRKSPEGWSESLKRMVRLHGVQLPPEDAKAIVRYLADHHGLTRSEAERSLYESERRVHWSEEHQDEDFKAACSVCHPLGRVLMQARDQEEWQLLRATHVAMFPLARGQMGGGPPQDEEDRFGGFGGQGRRGGGRRGGTAPTGARGGPGGNATPPMNPQGDRGDRVLAQLAEKQPLFTPEWETWSINRRDVPLAGTWTVTGHEIGRGDLLGTAELVRTADGEYDVHWQLQLRNGDRIDRRGKGLLYAGYSWRGRSTDPGEAGRTWREVLLLDARWETLRGRFFTGDHDEIGVDVTMHRHRARPRALVVETPWVTVPAKGHGIDVYGEEFGAEVTAADFHLGRGVTVQGCERVAANHVRLVLDVAPGTECGLRDVAFGTEPACAQIRLYDGVDYVRIRPTQGLARIGGVNLPKQIERFEAVAVHRGADKKPYTEDDVDLWAVAADWRLTEAIFRDDDDDLRYVGAIDAATGVFTPAIEGPNTARKWMANNTGEVYVECTVDLQVPVRPKDPDPPAKPTEPSPPTPGGAEAPAPQPPTPPGGEAPPAPAEPSAPPATAPAPGAQEPQPAKPAPPPPPVGQEPVLERRTFRARASLIVTVPQYIRWTRLEWEDDR